MFNNSRIFLGLICAALLGTQQAQAASKFWNPYIVTGAISGTGGVCRLTISPAIVGAGLIAGDAVNARSIAGATGCNVAATISTVVDSTHIELTGTTFGGAYTSGGCVDGGEWTATNTANWATTSTATCGSGGTAVPAVGDTITFDANSAAGGTIKAVSAINSGTLTCNNYTGGLDFSGVGTVALSNSAAPFNCSGTATRNMVWGGTWTVTAGAAGTQTIWNMGTASGTTMSGTAAVTLAGTPTAKSVLLGAPVSGAYPNFIFSGANVENIVSSAAAGTVTMDGLTIPASSALVLAGGVTYVFNNAPIGLSGTTNNPSMIAGSVGLGTGKATLSYSGTITVDWAVWNNIALVGTWNLTNAYSVSPAVTGYTTFANPTAAGIPSCTGC